MAFARTRASLSTASAHASDSNHSLLRPPSLKFTVQNKGTLLDLERKIRLITSFKSCSI